MPRAPALGVGLAGGLVGALHGGGGGTVVVPALDRISSLPRPALYGTAVVANVAIAFVGALVYAIQGSPLDVVVGIPLAAGGVVGSWLGPRLVSRLPGGVVRVAFLAVLAVSGTKLVLDAAGLHPVPDVVLGAPGGGLGAAALAAAVVIGLIVGAWSSALGIGSGLLTVPVLVFFLGSSLQGAEGTSLLVMLPNSIAGAVAHLRRGTASWPLGRRLSVGATVGTALGALIAGAVSEAVLGACVGGFVLLVAVDEVRRLVLTWRRDAGVTGLTPVGGHPPGGGSRHGESPERGSTAPDRSGDDEVCRDGTDSSPRSGDSSRSASASRSRCSPTTLDSEPN